MTRDAKATTTRAGLAALALCTLFTTPATAIDPDEAAPSTRQEEREILLAPFVEPGPFETWLAPEHFHIAKKSGIGYTRRLKLGDRSYGFSVRGPVMKKQKALGLAFRIRF